jgi:hypothetical protein
MLPCVCDAKDACRPPCGQLILFGMQWQVSYTCETAGQSVAVLSHALVQTGPKLWCGSGHKACCKLMDSGHARSNARKAISEPMHQHTRTGRALASKTVEMQAYVARLLNDTEPPISYLLRLLRLLSAYEHALSAYIATL